MSKMRSELLNIFLIEDEDAALESISPLLLEGEKLSIHTEIIENIDDVIQSAISHSPDLLLIDYDLQKTSKYMGGGVASTIQYELPGIPIIILTNPRVLQSRITTVPDELNAVDDILFKDDIIENPAKSVEFLVNVIHNFRTLNDCRKTRPKEILSLFNYENDEENQRIKESWMFQNNIQMILKEEYLFDTSIIDNWSPHSIYKWLTQSLFRFPGVFYEELYCATILGISLDSFKTEEISDFFDDAKYNGIFSENYTLWWRNRLLKKAYKILQEVGVGPPLSRNFIGAIAKKGFTPRPSLDYETNEPFADTVCELLKKPFLRKNTVEANFDNRPYFMDQARISFQGIIARGFNLNLLNPEEKAIVEKRLEGLL